VSSLDMRLLSSISSTITMRNPLLSTPCSASYDESYRLEKDWIYSISEHDERNCEECDDHSHPDETRNKSSLSEIQLGLSASLGILDLCNSRHGGFGALFPMFLSLRNRFRVAGLRPCPHML
jgi:hypothetical protein